MKRSQIIILVLAIFVFGFLFSRDSLARVAWQKYHSPATALFLAQEDIELLMNLGNYYFNGTIGKSEYKPEKAEKAYRKAVAINPKILWGHYQLARIYFVEGKSDLALEEIDQELESNPENLRSLYVRGLIYGYRGYPGDLAKAEADFYRFTLWAPSEWAGYNDLAWILSKENKFEEVKKVIAAALIKASYGQENPWLWNSLGVAQLNLGENSDAATSFINAQALAEKLTLDDWVRSYPGNDPEAASGGLIAFKSAIRENLKRAMSVHN